MTAIERVNKHINLEQPDRVGIAPMGEFYYAQMIDMSIEEMLMDPWRADQAFEFGFKRHGGVDMAEVAFLLAQYRARRRTSFPPSISTGTCPGANAIPTTSPISTSERWKIHS